MLLDIELPIYYAVVFENDSASVKKYDILPEIGHVIEISPRDDDGRGNGHYPVRFFVNGMLSSWETDCLKVVKMSAGYNWTDIQVSFDIEDKRGCKVTIIGEHGRFNLEEGIVSLMHIWGWCKKFHYADTINVYNKYDVFLSLNRIYQSEKWISERLFISFKRKLMEIDEYIKSTILICMEYGYTSDIEYLQGVRNELKQKLWDYQLTPKEENN